jgi:hypothetical protein
MSLALAPNRHRTWTRARLPGRVNPDVENCSWLSVSRSQVTVLSAIDSEVVEYGFYLSGGLYLPVVDQRLI